MSKVTVIILKCNNAKHRVYLFKDIQKSLHPFDFSNKQHSEVLWDWQH